MLEFLKSPRQWLPELFAIIISFLAINWFIEELQKPKPLTPNDYMTFQSFILDNKHIDVITESGEDLGRWPLLYIEREILREFSSSWTVEIEKQNKDGKLFAHCTVKAPRLNDYRSDNGLPDILTLAWWIDYESLRKCGHLAPGTYRIITSWPIEGTNITVKAVSNVQEITQEDIDGN